MQWNKKDGKIFWKLLNKLDNKKNDNMFKEKISGETWNSHFKSISNKKQDQNNTFPPNAEEKGPLDYEISMEEIKFGSYILRNGKAPGYDSISNEMISSLLSVRPDVFQALFNTILQNPQVIYIRGTPL